MKKKKHNIGDTILVYRLPSAREEAKGSQTMYPANAETGVVSPGRWTPGKVPVVGPLTTLMTVANGLQQRELKHHDHEKEAWLGEVVEISGNNHLIFPTSYMVKWFHPVLAIRVYCGIGPPGTMNIYDPIKVDLTRRWLRALASFFTKVVSKNV